MPKATPFRHTPMNPVSSPDSVLHRFSKVDLKGNLSRADLVARILQRKEAILTSTGALATWTPPHSTGRIPKDTYMVRHPESENKIDWSSSACNPLDPAVFDTLLEDALHVLERKTELYSMDLCVGHDPRYALPVHLLTDSPLSALFARNMLLQMESDMQESVFADTPFTLLVLPKDTIDPEKYEGAIREGVPRIVATDFDRRIGIVYGLQYCGGVKKTLFTAMNYLLPEFGVLPLHCSANEYQGESALFLGLSGTGKTTVSNDPLRSLVGDDEHGWTESGIFNMEDGCYAKLIDLSEEKEPEVFSAVFSERDPESNGCIIENALMYPSGRVDVYDSRLAQNSRASYPLSFLRNTKDDAVTVHPRTIIFLTADASGVLPPIAKLSTEEAMLWFLMGYTSKLAGTEVGIEKPIAFFSRFFGEAFMPRVPKDYAELLGKKLEKFGSDVYLINTGWTGGPYGVGERFAIPLTRTLVDAALDGSLRDCPFRRDERFHLSVPRQVTGVEDALLDPASTWEDGDAYERAADELAEQFAEHFRETYGDSGFDEAICRACPGM